MQARSFQQALNGHMHFYIVINDKHCSSTPERHRGLQAEACQMADMESDIRRVRWLDEANPLSPVAVYL